MSNLDLAVLSSSAKGARHDVVEVKSLALDH